MMKRKVCKVAIMGMLGVLPLLVPGRLPAQSQQSSDHPNLPTMNSFVAIFEIPATDMERAVHFYEAILGLDIQQMEFEGLEMGLFPYENQAVTGVIMKGEGYEPSANGVTIYLNGGNDLQIVLNKVVANGGKVLVPKTPHADESGFFALFTDTEGNKLGLHSPH